MSQPTEPAPAPQAPDAAVPSKKMKKIKDDSGGGGGRGIFSKITRKLAWVFSGIIFAGIFFWGPVGKGAPILCGLDRYNSLPAKLDAHRRGQQVRRRYPREYGIRRQARARDPIIGEKETCHVETFHRSDVHQLRSLPRHRLPAHLELLQTTGQHRLRRRRSRWRSRVQLR